MPELSRKDDESLSDSLKQFLDIQSKAQRRTIYCAGCGSVCMHLSAEFWLDGDEETFSIGLPFCPHCNPELLTRAPMAA